MFAVVVSLVLCQILPRVFHELSSMSCSTLLTRFTWPNQWSFMLPRMLSPTSFVKRQSHERQMKYNSLRLHIGSRPSDHYFRSVCLSVCLFVCAEFFSAVFDPISIKLGHMLYVWV